MRRALGAMRRPAIVALLAIGLAVSAQPALASAAPQPPSPAGDVGTLAIPCDGYVGSWYTLNSVSKPKKITHKDRIYNGGELNSTSTYQATWQQTLTAGVSISAGTSISASAIIGELSATAGITLEASGSATSGGSISVTATIKPKQYMIVYAGRVQVTSGWKKNTCSSGGGSVVTSGSGTARSHGIQEIGSAACNVSQPAGSLAALAKSLHC